MAGLIDFLPDADALIALTAEDLGAILLELVQKERGNFTLSNLEMPLWNAGTAKYPQHRRMEVARALAEAWQWLQNEGLLMEAPDSNGWFCLTRKGTRLKNTADIEAYRHGNVLPIGLLHSTIAEKVRPMFMRGDYDVAVFQAFKEVEVAVREENAQRSRSIVVCELHKICFQVIRFMRRQPGNCIKPADKGGPVRMNALRLHPVIRPAEFTNPLVTSCPLLEVKDRNVMMLPFLRHEIDIAEGTGPLPLCPKSETAGIAGRFLHNRQMRRRGASAALQREVGAVLHSGRKRQSGASRKFSAVAALGVIRNDRWTS